MNNEDAEKICKHIHNVRNPLNSIALHAEWGKMLLEGENKSDELKNIFSVILKQCTECDRVLSEIRELSAQGSD